jgi:hypothetical protein
LKHNIIANICITANVTADCEDDVNVPHYKTQGREIHAALQQRLKAGDSYMVDLPKLITVA